MIRRQHKKYSRPRKLFEKARIEEENLLIKKYGLKNKREIWKADYQVEKIRNLAKKFITSPAAKQEEFIDRLAAKGLVKSKAQLDDVLALKKEAILERRLQTIVFKKGHSRTPKGARQLITHRHVKVGDRIVTIPSYFVDLNEESLISLKERKKKMKMQGEQEKGEENV